jgi:hypothetical protein
LTSIPQNARISSATLELWISGWAGGGTTGSYGLYRISRNWSEATATWKNASEGTLWNNPGGDYLSTQISSATFARASGKSWIQYNVLSAVRDFVINPASNYGFLIRNSTGSQEIIIASSENSTKTRGPKLTVTYETPSAVLRTPSAIEMHEAIATGMGEAFSINGRPFDSSNRQQNARGVFVVRMTGGANAALRLLCP